MIDMFNFYKTSLTYVNFFCVMGIFHFCQIGIFHQCVSLGKLLIKNDDNALNIKQSMLLSFAVVTFGKRLNTLQKVFKYLKVTYV